jgi:hypothetical protein
MALLTNLKEAFRAVPGAKHALETAAILWVVVIVKGFRVSIWVAVFAVVILFLLLTILVAFGSFSASSAATRTPVRAFAPIAAVAMLVGSGVLLSSLFFKAPLDIEQLLDGVQSLTLSSEGPPVYNATFAPTHGDHLATLLDHQKTTARFFIGPPNAHNAISESRWTVNPGLLSDPSNVPLTITMTCPFCAGKSVFKKVATYFGQKRASSEVLFDFVPLRSLTRYRFRFHRIPGGKPWGSVR